MYLMVSVYHWISTCHLPFLLRKPKTENKSIFLFRSFCVFFSQSVIINRSFTETLDNWFDWFSGCIVGNTISNEQHHNRNPEKETVGKNNDNNYNVWKFDLFFGHHQQYNIGKCHLAQCGRKFGDAILKKMAIVSM